MQRVVSDPMIGVLLGDRYTVRAKLGNGAMGSVYRCADKKTGRELAVKVLAPGLADAMKAEERFRQEIKAATLLSHRNIVATSDFGHTSDGRPFYAMELVEGQPLSALVKSSAPIEPFRAFRIARDVASGLQHAHDKGIVHRDIKPDNVILGVVEGGEVAKILDFGILKILAGSEITAQQLTQAGSVVGTLFYLPLEALTGQLVDGRADLYALGCVLFELLTGSRPYTASDAVQMMNALRNAPTPTLADRGVQVPTAVERLIKSLLAKTPHDRPANASQVIAQLDAILATEPESAVDVHAQQTQIFQTAVPQQPLRSPNIRPRTRQPDSSRGSAQRDTGHDSPTDIVSLPPSDHTTSRRAILQRLPPGTAYAVTGIVALAILLVMLASMCGD